MTFFHIALSFLCIVYSTLSAMPCFEPVGSATIAFDSFRSVPDGVSQNNNGALITANVSQTVAQFLQLRAQIGGSFGIYDWSGRSSPFDTDLSRPQKQTFITGGLSTQTTSCSGINAAVVFDYNWNQGYGVFGLNSNMGQFRGQIGYLFCGHHELGVWGTVRNGFSQTKLLTIPIVFRAIDQVSLFWTYYFHELSYVMLSAGVPYGHSLFFSEGKPGRYLLGGRCCAFLSNCLSITGHMAYMTGRNQLGPAIRASSDAYNVCIGLTYFFGRNKACRQPYLPVADNSNFLVDTNLNQLNLL